MCLWKKCLIMTVEKRKNNYLRFLIIDTITHFPVRSVTRQLFLLIEERQKQQRPTPVL